MTAHPINTEALRREALGQLGLAAMDPRWPGRVLIILDALAAAEHRATRAEAQAAIRGRAVVMYRERAREAEARIKAVEDVHRKWTVGDPCDKRRGCGGADCAPHVNGYGDKVWRHWRDDCTGCAATWPCPTTRALDGDA